MGLSKTKGPALIIFGDILFSEKLFDGVNFNSSFVIYDDNKYRENEIGFNDRDGKVLRFGYGLPKIWSHIVFLDNHEKKLFLKAMKLAHSKKMLCFEILNWILDNGGNFNSVNAKTMPVLEVDNQKDLEYARENIKFLEKEIIPIESFMLI